MMMNNSNSSRSRSNDNKEDRDPIGSFSNDITASFSHDQVSSNDRHDDDHVNLLVVDADEQSPTVEVEDDLSMSAVSVGSFKTGISRATTNSDLLDHARSPPLPSPSERNMIAAKETTAVRSLRVVIILIMLGLAILACVGIYLYSLSTEQGEFQTAFTSQGLKVISGFQGDSFRKLQALESLSNSFTSYADISGSQWPFVTVPNSATHFEPYLSLTRAASILIQPIVGPRQRYQWETYVQAHQHWIDEDLRATGTTTTKNNSTDPKENEVSTFIKNYVGIDTSPNPWLVWWQYAPVIPNRYFVNFNRLAWEGLAQEVKAVQLGKATLSRTWAFEPGLDLQSTKDFEFTQQLLQAGRHGTYESGEPIGYIHYPVFDTHNHDNMSDHDQQKAAKVVAVLTATVYWRSYMQNLLPETENGGIVCVIANTLGQIYSYRIHGPQADFLGPGDLHDPQYTHMGISANYDDAFSSSQHDATSWYTGVPVDTDHISYTIHVYPTKELEESYMTNKPILYASSIFVVFLVTVAVFVLYDFCVAKRQTIVLDSALKSNAVVESLFPISNVRDQIMDNAMQQQQQQRNSSSAHTSTFLAAASDNSPHNAARDSTAISASTTTAAHGNAIAHLYPETTICFADLAGFTQWSSKRTPTEVFELLETLYGAFDRIALRRRVFKVETIGDCYVCVTGIPNPQMDHAVIMSRFARDCQTELYKLTADLAELLGEDTKDLEMRVGLHSGPTTGGVLRGDKGRFQLFGDTVNTASRMESNGIRGRIHVSQATADALSARGKSHWLVARDDKIQAKGKGLMQTYFVNVTGAKASSADSSHFRENLSTSKKDPSPPQPERAPTSIMASQNERESAFSKDVMAEYNELVDV